MPTLFLLRTVEIPPTVSPEFGLWPGQVQDMSCIPLGPVPRDSFVIISQVFGKKLDHDRTRNLRRDRLQVSLGIYLIRKKTIGTRRPLVQGKDHWYRVTILWGVVPAYAPVITSVTPEPMMAADLLAPKRMQLLFGEFANV